MPLLDRQCQAQQPVGLPGSRAVSVLPPPRAPAATSLSHTLFPPQRTQEPGAQPWIGCPCHAQEEEGLLRVLPGGLWGAVWGEPLPAEPLL